MSGEDLRNVIERCFRRLKDFRRIAMRSPETSFSRSASLLSLRIGFELFESGPARDHLARLGGAEPAAWRHLPLGSWGYVSLTKLALHQFNPSIRLRMCLSPLALHVL